MIEELGSLDSDDFFLKAFQDLSTCRQNGFGLGSIPWNFIRDYARLKQLDEDVADLFVDVILAMDRTYLAWEAEEAEKRRKSPGGK